MNDPKVLDETQKQDQKVTKQPYEKPAVIYRAPLEATAGDCNITPPGKAEGTCTNVIS
jgi:hypothetical protein